MRATARQAITIVGVDMHDRDLEAFGQVARIQRRARIAWLGGEADLVVGDDMDGAAGAVAGQLREVERLGHDALAGERRVAMEQDRQRGALILGRHAGLVALLLGRARAPFDHRVDELQVAGVGRQGDRHLLDAALFVGAPRAQVVLDIADPADAAFAGGRSAGVAVGGVELREDIGIWLAKHMRQDVEPPAVRHADHYLARSVGGGVADDLVEHRHQHVAALDREALLADEGGVQIALEHLDFGQPLQQLALARRGRR